MKIQVLVSTIGRSEYSFLDKMNLKTDVVVGNQNGVCSSTEWSYTYGKIKVISSDTKGLSRNRNITLENSTGDILLVADDDLIYMDNYVQCVSDAFTNYPDADVIIFNLYENPRKRYVIKRKFNVCGLNYLRFGSVRIAFKRKSIIDAGIKFNENFGAGADIPLGEDNIFLHDCLMKKLKIIAVPVYLLTLTNERESTWFEGYNDTYFQNKGLLYKELYPCTWFFFCMQDVIRHRKMYVNNGSWIHNLRTMM